MSALLLKAGSPGSGWVASPGESDKAGFAPSETVPVVCRLSAIYRKGRFFVGSESFATSDRVV